MVDTRIMSKLVKKVNQVERKEKSVREAELELSIQKDIEQQERKSKRERQTA